MSEGAPRPAANGLSRGGAGMIARLVRGRLRMSIAAGGRARPVIDGIPCSTRVPGPEYVI